jgi:hypothetical protein
MGLGLSLIYEIENKSHVPNHQPDKICWIICPNINEILSRNMPKSSKIYGPYPNQIPNSMKVCMGYGKSSWNMIWK